MTVLFEGDQLCVHPWLGFGHQPNSTGPPSAEVCAGGAALCLSSCCKLLARLGSLGLCSQGPARGLPLAQLLLITVFIDFCLSQKLYLSSPPLSFLLSLSRLRAGDGDVPPAPQLHPQPRGRLLLRLRGRPRDRPRVGDRDRAITMQMLDPSSFLHPFLPKRLGAKPRPAGNLARWLFPTGWAWSTMAKATGAPTRPVWGASWHHWCRLPSTATTGPAAASRSSTATSSRSPSTPPPLPWRDRARPLGYPLFFFFFVLHKGRRNTQSGFVCRGGCAE